MSLKTFLAKLHRNQILVEGMQLGHSNIFGFRLILSFPNLLSFLDKT